MEISVIVPVYNVEKYLNRCVDSILSQTFTDFELLLIDDGSTDGSGSICDEYAAKDSRVKVFHKENGGLSDARNCGIENAIDSETKWITFIDSDDWLHGRYLEILYGACKTHGVDIACCNFAVKYDYSADEKIASVNETLFTPEKYWCYSQRNAAITWCKLYKKDLFKNLRFPKGLIHEDEFTTYKALFSTDKIVLVDLPIYYYFVNVESITRVKWSTKKLVAFTAYKEQCEYFLEHGFIEAFKCSNRAYVWMIFYMFCESVVVPKEYKKYKRITLRRWKQDFKRWRKSDLLKNNKKYRWPFLWFYPIKIGLIDNVKDVIKQGGLKAVKEKIKEHKRNKADYKN